MTVSVPTGLIRRSPPPAGWSAWLDRLPRLVRELTVEWELERDGPAQAGTAALVLPVRTAECDPAVLKLGWPHPEAAYEHLALQAWAGEGAVRLLRADPHRWALLLERAGGEDLHSVPVLEACTVVAGLYPRLHRAPLPQLDRLSTRAADWAQRLRALHDHPGVPRRLADQAAGLARDFAADPGTDTALLHTDLHYGNVLRRAAGDPQGEPWLAIDPKPVAGDPHYEPAPLLWNRWSEAAAEPQLRQALLERLYTVVDVAGLDEDRAKDWVVVRAMVNVLWALQSGEPEPGVARSIILAKAAQR